MPHSNIQNSNTFYSLSASTRQVLTQQQAHPSSSAAALPESQTQNALVQLRSLLKHEGSCRNFSNFFDLRRLLPLLEESWKALKDESAFLRLEQQWNASQGHLQEAEALYDFLSRQGSGEAELLTLRNELDRIQGYEELESSCRSLFFFLGRSDWEKAASLVTLGSQVMASL